ncbi:hypothetical protein MMC28_002354 [Mycoblastus sanguinarius]|nr:hypothetical protein [Mycoblastus sanguinarius]
MSSPRVAQAADNVDVDLELPSRGIGAIVKTTTTYDFINKLWNAEENQDVVKKFLNNRLCKICAENKDPNALELFQTYAVQDYFYLVDYVKFKALRLTTIPQSEFDILVAEAESVGRMPAYMSSWMDMCKRIGLTPDRIQSTERSVAELAYANYLQINASRDNWFSLHVIMIACAYGWSKIAKKLYDEGSTDKNSEFYKEWILVNIDTSDSVNNADFFSSDARKLSNFLDQNVEIWNN